MKLNKNTAQSKRRDRIRAKLLATTTRPRLTVVRSNSHIFAQIIDLSGKVMAAFGSSSLKKEKGTKTEKSKLVGERLAEIAKKNKVTEVVFDRGSYRFHGRVKALAEAVRQSGIKF